MSRPPPRTRGGRRRRRAAPGSCQTTSGAARRRSGLACSRRGRLPLVSLPGARVVVNDDEILGLPAVEVARLWAAVDKGNALVLELGRVAVLSDHARMGPAKPASRATAAAMRPSCTRRRAPRSRRPSGRSTGRPAGRPSGRSTGRTAAGRCATETRKRQTSWAEHAGRKPNGLAVGRWVGQTVLASRVRTLAP